MFSCDEDLVSSVIYHDYQSTDLTESSSASVHHQQHQRQRLQEQKRRDERMMARNTTMTTSGAFPSSRLTQRRRVQTSSPRRRQSISSNSPIREFFDDDDYGERCRRDINGAGGGKSGEQQEQQSRAHQQQQQQNEHAASTPSEAPSAATTTNTGAATGTCSGSTSRSNATASTSSSAIAAINLAVPTKIIEQSRCDGEGRANDSCGDVACTVDHSKQPQQHSPQLSSSSSTTTTRTTTPAAAAATATIIRPGTALTLEMCLPTTTTRTTSSKTTTTENMKNDGAQQEQEHERQHERQREEQQQEQHPHSENKLHSSAHDNNLTTTRALPTETRTPDEWGTQQGDTSINVSCRHGNSSKRSRLPQNTNDVNQVHLVHQQDGTGDVSKVTPAAATTSAVAETTPSIAAPSLSSVEVHVQTTTAATLYDPTGALVVKPTHDTTEHKKKTSCSPPTTGRWTNAEHQAFLDGLRECGREWKKVALKIPTRTSAQIRSHAQKYFSKLAREQAAAAASMHHQQQLYSSASSTMLTTAFTSSYSADEGKFVDRGGQYHSGLTAQRILADPQSAQREVENTLQALRERYRLLQERLDRRRRRRRQERRSRCHDGHSHDENEGDDCDHTTATDHNDRSHDDGCDDDDGNFSHHSSRHHLLPPQLHKLSSSRNEPPPPVLAVSAFTHGVGPSKSHSNNHSGNDNLSISSNLSSAASRTSLCDLGNEEIIALQVLGGDLRADTYSAGSPSHTAEPRSSRPSFGTGSQCINDQLNDERVVPTEIAVLQEQQLQEKQQHEETLGMCSDADPAPKSSHEEQNEDSSPSSFRSRKRKHTNPDDN